MVSKDAPVVILVGGPNTGKSLFYTKHTTSVYQPSTTNASPNVVVSANPVFVIVDTPGSPEKRNKDDYSWQGIFKLADVILTFGNWSEREIHGKKRSLNPKYIEWSGDSDETLKRIEEYLQGR
jgi:hypothetical protein